MTKQALSSPNPAPAGFGQSPQAQAGVEDAIRAMAIGVPALGGVTGAGLGVLLQALRRSDSADERKKPSLLNGALLGGLAGATVGGAVGLPMAYQLEVSRQALKSLTKESSTMTKQALDPRISAALQLGLLGAGGGLAFQGVRKMLQGRDDEEENGSPSLLRGALTGGLLGAAGGGGLAHLLGLHEGGAPSSSFGSPSQGLGADLAGAAPKPSPASLNPNSLMAALQDNEPFTMGFAQRRAQ